MVSLCTCLASCASVMLKCCIVLLSCCSMPSITASCVANKDCFCSSCDFIMVRWLTSTESNRVFVSFANAYAAAVSSAWASRIFLSWLFVGNSILLQLVLEGCPSLGPLSIKLFESLSQQWCVEFDRLVTLFALFVVFNVLIYEIFVFCMIRDGIRVVDGSWVSCTFFNLLCIWVLCDTY